MTIPFRTVLIAVGVSLVAIPVMAQKTRPTRTCAVASTLLANGSPLQPTDQWAYSFIVACPGGGAALAHAWTPPPTDSLEVAELRRGSTQLADLELLNATLAALQDVNQPMLTRRAALQVVVAQYAPQYDVSGATWNQPETAGVGIQADYYQVAGSNPVTPADRQRIISVLQSMGVSEPDLKLRAVTHAIADYLAL
jgi:hypothetical protein